MYKARPREHFVEALSSIMKSNVINSELQQMQTSASIALANELVCLIGIKLTGAYPESNKNIPHTRLTM
jgi:hypothetical protein